MLSLEINESSSIKNHTNECTDTIEKVIYGYKNHPSVY